MPRTPDEQRQVLMTRRAIAAGVGLLIIILVVLGIQGCLSARNERAVKSYINDVSTILAESNDESKAFFELLRTPGDSGPTEIETAINEQRSQAADLVRRAEKLSTPSGLKSANRYVIETLGFRRDGLASIAKQISPALGDENPETATEAIAADMQNFIASDVIYSQRAVPAMRAELRKEKLPVDGVPASRFLESYKWLDPLTVDDVLSRARGQSASGEVAPGIHGTGITAVKALPGGTALQAGGSATLTGQKSLSIDVQNQGENDEKNVVVIVTITGDGTPITLQDKISKVAAGATATVTLPFTSTPAKGTSATIKVEVRRVPGEKNVENNRQSFNVTFG